MNLFGLEGSGFLLSICLTLFLSGMIVFYVRQKFNETDHKIQHMLGIVQQLNASNIPKPHPIPQGGGISLSENTIIADSLPPSDANLPQNGIDMNLLSNMPPIPEETTPQRINISESSEISSTTDVDEDDLDDDLDEDEDVENADDDDADDTVDDNAVVDVDNILEKDNEQLNTEVEVLDVEELKEDVKVIDDIPSGNKVINIESMDDIKLEDFDTEDFNVDATTDSDESEVKIESNNLDSMLLGMLDSIQNKKSNSTQDNSKTIDVDKLSLSTNLNELKVTELRQMIKDKGLQVQNLSKMKKSECIELLAE